MSKPTALVIDDNARNVAVLSHLLEEQNVNNTQITNPTLIDQTLEQIDQVDIIFLDLEMPGLNGFDIIERIKANSRFRDVPVIAYTVHAEEISQVHQRGFDGFIGKPIDPDKFPDQLARLLRGEPVWEIA